jgi:hypothetical protein
VRGYCSFAALGHRVSSQLTQCTTKSLAIYAVAHNHTLVLLWQFVTPLLDNTVAVGGRGAKLKALQVTMVPRNPRYQPTRSVL